jgi:hypothetical protein
MMRRASERIVVLLILAVAVSTSARADVKLPSVLNSHMVLQRDMPVPVWISVTGANERGMKNLKKNHAR